MFGPDYFGSHDFLERLRGGICGWQDHRARRRAAQTHHAAPVSGPPPATMHSGSAPAAGPPPAGSPVLVCFHAVRGRLVPVFGDPAEFAGATGQADETQQAPPVATAPPSPASQVAPPSPPRPAPASAGPQEHTAQGARNAPTTVEPPDFSVQAVQASASSRSAQPARPPSSERPGPATVLNLSPPTPPSLVRTDEQAVTVERVLAQHRTEMEASEARQVAALRDVLAEHRQSLADLLAQHREALREQAEAGTDDAQAFAQLRELLTEQARIMQDEHGRTADANADLAGMIAGLGETVNRLAVAVAERRAPSFGPPPRRTQGPGQETAPVTAPTPAVPATQAASPDAPPHPEPEQPDSAAARPLSVVRIAPTQSAPTRSPPRAAPLAASASASSTSSRACVSSVTASLASVFAAAPTATASASMTPHQRRIAEEARQREHVHESIADDDDDDNATLEAPHG